MLKKTENGAVAITTTADKVLDLFAFGGAYRKRTKNDCIALFREAYEQEPTLALKCLFYLRDVRGGQGERRLFRICMKWLANNHPQVAQRLLPLVPEYGRWDEVYRIFLETPCKGAAIELIRETLVEDLKTDTPTLLGKYLPSENSSSLVTKQNAKKIRSYLELTSREYRKVLVFLRKKINIVESLMSQNHWEKIEFDKLPAKAGLRYSQAFTRNPLTKEKYALFTNSKEKKVNAGTLYPYEIVERIFKGNTDREVLNKYWENLPDYFNGDNSDILCVVDTSGSMRGKPLSAAVALGIYCAERTKGSFHNQFMTFSRHPQLIQLGKEDFYSKARKILYRCINDTTNLEAIFDLLLNMIKKGLAKAEDLPKRICIISDMEINEATAHTSRRIFKKEETTLFMYEMRERWAKAGLTLPSLVYWNVNARNNTILENGPDVSFVSGLSPILFQSILTGKTGRELMLATINSKRYEMISAYF